DFLSGKVGRRLSYRWWNLRQVRIRGGSAEEERVTSGRVQPRFEKVALRSLARYLSRVARIPFARRVRLWSCQRLWGECSRPDRPGSLARFSSNRMVEKWEEYRRPQQGTRPLRRAD